MKIFKSLPTKYENIYIIHLFNPFKISANKREQSCCGQIQFSIPFYSIQFKQKLKQLTHKIQKLIKCTLLIKSTRRRVNFSLQTRNVINCSNSFLQLFCTLMARPTRFALIERVKQCKQIYTIQGMNEREIERMRARAHTRTLGQLNSISAIYFRVRF